jgi:hypothetical protein
MISIDTPSLASVANLILFAYNIQDKNLADLDVGVSYRIAFWRLNARNAILRQG